MVDKAQRRLAPDHPTGPQIRAARALVGMSAAQLAEAASVAVNTIKRAEAADGLAPITAGNATLILQAIREAGVELIASDALHGDGARLTNPRINA